MTARWCARCARHHLHGKCPDVYGGPDCICLAQLMGWAFGHMCPAHPPRERPT